MHSEPTVPRPVRASTTARDPNFYLLPFASQMIVWAMRKHLDTRYARAVGNADEVLHVFHMADWGELYTGLVAVFEIVACSGRGLVRHAVACPCLSPHEAHLLNAVAHLRYDRRDEAVLSLCEMLSPAGARLTLPHLAVIATTLAEAGLDLAHVRINAFASPGTGLPGAPQDVH